MSVGDIDPTIWARVVSSPIAPLVNTDAAKVHVFAGKHNRVNRPFPTYGAGRMRLLWVVNGNSVMQETYKLAVFPSTQAT
jgi:hypothetical protein